MTDVWPGTPHAVRRRRLLGAGMALAGAVLSGASLFLPWDRSCADLGRFAPGPVCSSASGLRAGGALAVALLVGAVAVAVVIPTLRWAAVPWAAVVGLGVAGAIVALGAIEALGGSAWGVWPWIAGGAIQAGAHIWTLIRTGPSAP
jgi:hypothetical protein